MSSRNRGRANHNNQDADEERRLWAEIKTRARDVKEMTVCETFSFAFYRNLAFPFSCETFHPRCVPSTVLYEPLDLSSKQVV